MRLGQLSTRSCLTHPEVSSMTFSDFFCLFVCRFFYPRQSIKTHSVYILQPISSAFQHFATNFFCIPAFCKHFLLHSSILQPITTAFQHFAINFFCIPSFCNQFLLHCRILQPISSAFQHFVQNCCDVQPTSLTIKKNCTFCPDCNNIFCI